MWMTFGGALAHANNSKSSSSTQYIPFVRSHIASPSLTECQKTSDGSELRLIGGKPQQWLSKSSQWPETSASGCNIPSHRNKMFTRSPSEDDNLLSPQRVVCRCKECQVKARRTSDSAVFWRDAQRCRVIAHNHRHSNNRVGLARGEDECHPVSCCLAKKVPTNQASLPLPSTVVMASTCQRMTETMPSDQHALQRSDHYRNPMSCFQRPEFTSRAALLSGRSTGDLSRSSLSVLPDGLLVKSRTWDESHEKPSYRTRSHLKAFNPLAKPHEITFHSRDWTDKNFTFLTPLSAFTAPE